MIFVYLKLKTNKMKKVLLIATCIATMSLVSCKKDHTCTCTAFGIISESMVIEDSSKKDAKDKCGAYEAEGAGLVSCELD